MRLTIGVLALFLVAGLVACGGDAADENGAGDESGVKLSEKHETPGFVVYEVEGRLWIFKDGSDAQKAFADGTEPAKRVTRVGAGPDGETIIAVDGSVLDAFAAARK